MQLTRADGRSLFLAMHTPIQSAKRRSFHQRFTSSFALCALSAVGCGGDWSPGFLGDPATISGQIANWSQGSYGSFAFTATLYGNNAPIATAPIDGAGRFSLTMPPLSAIRNMLPERDVMHHGTLPGCTGSIQASSNTYRMTFVWFNVDLDNQGVTVSYRSKDDDGSDPFRIEPFDVQYYLIDGSFSQTGEVNCPQFTEPLRYALSLQPGLNRVIETRSKADPYLIMGYSSGPLPTEMVWVQNAR